MTPLELLGAGLAGAGTVAAGADGWLGAGLLGWVWVEGADWLDPEDGEEPCEDEPACGGAPGARNPSWPGVASGGIFSAVAPARAVRGDGPVTRALDLAPIVCP